MNDHLRGIHEAAVLLALVALAVLGLHQHRLVLEHEVQIRDLARSVAEVYGSEGGAGAEGQNE